MSDNLQSLLQPTLTNVPKTKPMYSVQSHFFAAFFGGPVGFLLFSFYNVYQAGLAKKWWVRYLVLAVVLIVAEILVFVAWKSDLFSTLFSLNLESREVRYILKFMALLALGGVYLWQKELFQISAFKAEERPAPWVPVIACIATGSAVSLIISAGVIFYVG